MMKIISIFLACLTLLINPSIEVESTVVEPVTYNCEADYDGTRIFNDNHIEPPYRCQYCQYKCLDTYYNTHCMACLVDYRNCRGAEYEYRDIDVYAELTETQLEFMAGTNVLAMGDSIMEGYGNGFWGTADMLSSLYGVSIVSDTAASGCLLTNYQEPYTRIPNIYTQLAQTEATVDLKHLPANTFFVMDGGFNDQLWGYSTLPEMTFYDAQNGEHDLLYSTEYIVRRILEDTNHTIPVIYIVPCLADMGSTEGSGAQLELLKSLQQEGVYVVDELAIVNSDDFSDSIHINETGYNKVTKVISQCVCDYYNIQ